MWYRVPLVLEKHGVYDHYVCCTYLGYPFVHLTTPGLLESQHFIKKSRDVVMIK